MAEAWRAPDARFFETLAAASVGELADLTGARLLRGEPARPIERVAALNWAEPGSVTFLADAKHADTLARGRPGACFMAEPLADLAPGECAVLATLLPQAGYALAALRLHRPRIHPSGAPSVHPDAELEDGVEVAPGVTIGPGATIGRGTRIGAGAAIGPGVAVGRDCAIGPRVVIGFALIGDHVKILAGAIVGEAGFGATPGAKGVIDVPQLGGVIIQDGVTIGANSCVDRGTFEDTVIGENTKIDNLVQVAHNVVIGRNCVLAAHCGISGSVEIGDDCMFGGRVGIADHVVIGAGARLAAASGVMRDVPPGEAWGGTPARPVRQWMRETAWISAMASRQKSRGAKK